MVFLAMIFFAYIPIVGCNYFLQGQCSYRAGSLSHCTKSTICLTHRKVDQYSEKKSNEEVMEMAGYKRSLLKTIRKRQLQRFGYINRADGLEKQILSGKICGTKSRGRQRTEYTVSLNNFVTRKESPNS